MPALAAAGQRDALAFFTCPYCRVAVRIDVPITYEDDGPIDVVVDLHLRKGCAELHP
jgi:hypothetical protein